MKRQKPAMNVAKTMKVLRLPWKELVPENFGKIPWPMVLTLDTLVWYQMVTVSHSVMYGTRMGSVLIAWHLRQLHLIKGVGLGMRSGTSHILRIRMTILIVSECINMIVWGMSQNVWEHICVSYRKPRESWLTASMWKAVLAALLSLPSKSSLQIMGKPYDHARQEMKVIRWK